MTNETKHTPGEWRNGIGSIGITGPNSPAILGPTVKEQCENNTWLRTHLEEDYPKCNHTVIASEQDTLAIVVGPNREANARLIAAAPDLLEALERAIAETPKRYTDKTRRGDKIAEYPDWTIQARAAVAKAKGGES